MNTSLCHVFSNVNDWLKFAEAKNAMIVAFNSASIYGAAQLYSSDKLKVDGFFHYYLLLAIFILIFSTVCSLISFAPRVRIVKAGLYSKVIAPNVLFFEYLRTRSASQIVGEITGNVDESSYKRIDLDIAEQIRQNSMTASRKYSYFTIAVWLTIAAYISIPLAGLFCFTTYIKD